MRRIRKQYKSRIRVDRIDRTLFPYGGYFACWCPECNEQSRQWARVQMALLREVSDP